jgi:hypothetical protein
VYTQSLLTNEEDLPELELAQGDLDHLLQDDDHEEEADPVLHRLHQPHLVAGRVPLHHQLDRAPRG